MHLIEINDSKGRLAAKVGLRHHWETPHRCDVQIDYHGDKRPADYVEGFCPREAHDPALQTAIGEAIEIEDMGGLSAWTGRALAELPYRLVDFYRGVTGARDRLVAERDAKRERVK